MVLKKVLILRHAESIEDVSPQLHSVPNDADVILTSMGRFQLRAVARKLTPIVVGRSVRVVVSPSNRAIETHRAIARLCRSIPTTARIDVRLRNLNWGDVTLENRRSIEEERYRIGVLRYKFPGGDDSAQYVEMIASFAAELQTESVLHDECPEVLLIITHGFALRVLVKCLCDFSEQDFRWLSNPQNAFVAVLEKKHHGFELLTKMPVVYDQVDYVDTLLQGGKGDH